MTKIVSKKSARKTVAKKAAAKKAAAVVAHTGVGRPSEYAGKKLYPTAAAKKSNPRRKGVKGFKSMELIRQSPGLTYEAFLADGGRNTDLHWDVDHEHVMVR